MRCAKLLFGVLGFLFIATSCALAQDPGWPRQITSAGGTLIYYQPQVDDWNHFEQLGRAIRPSIPATEVFRRLGRTQAVAANVRPGRSQ